MKKAIFLFTFLLLIVFFVKGQEFVKFDLSDGLSSLEVTDIKVNENYLWIATSDGLNRFDGKNFKVYRHNSNQKNSISGNNIESLFFDSRGFLWIGLKTGGLDVYDPKKDKFYSINDIIDIPPPVRVVSVFEDSGKTIWLGTWEQGVFQLIPKNGEKMQFTAINHFQGYIVSSVTEKPKGFLRVGTYSGLLYLDIKKNEWTVNAIPKYVITQMLPIDGENEIWCSTWDSGLIKITWENENPVETNSEVLLSYNKSGPIHRILRNNKKTLYMGTWGNSLLKSDVSNPSKIILPEKMNFPPSFINCIFRDNFKNIWVGTFGEGLFKFNTEETGIVHFPFSEKLPKPASALAPFGENTVIIGTQGDGLLKLDLQRNTLTPWFADKFAGNFEKNILSIYPFENYLFVGHDGDGLFYAEQTGKNISHQIKNFTGLLKVTAVYADPTGTFWIGTKQNGLISLRINPWTNRYEYYKYYPQIGHDRITGLEPLDYEKLFIASNNGLLLVNKAPNASIKEVGTILNEPVYKILKDPENNVLWIGTSTNLLSCRLAKPDSVYNIFSEGLLPLGAIRTLQPDSANNLWFSIDERLFCMTRNDRRLREINPALLKKSVILSGTQIKTKGGEKLIFGTSEDLLVIEPQKLIGQSGVSKIILTKLEIDNRTINVGDEINGKVILNEAAEYISSLELSHKSRWISLWLVESGSNNLKTSYQFRIKGFSDAWQFINLENPVTFSQLLPGSYTLEIRPFNNNETEKLCWSLDLTITPPWWQTNWFKYLSAITIVLFLGILLVLLYYRIQRKHLQKLRQIEKEKQEELLNEKESFFAGLSHDLLTTFSLILAPVNDLIRENKQSAGNREKLEIIKKNTSFLSDLFGAIFDFKQAEFSDKKLKENIIELNTFVKICVQAFDYLALSRNIKLVYQPHFESLQVKIDNIKLERIIYNLVSNAIKFTPDGGEVSVSINFSDKNNTISLIVKDNGVGMDIKNQHLIFEKFYREQKTNVSGAPNGLGLGLFIVRKFVSILGGTIEVGSVLNKGTAITVQLPVNVVKEQADGSVPRQVVSNDKSTILVIEDNRQLLEYTTSKLKTHFNVISAHDGNEAMAVIEKYVPEIIITDIMMPGLDGLSLTKKIKEDSRFSDIFVIILTAKATTEDELNGYRQGADIYLKKPVDLEVLLNQLINIHKTRQQRKLQLYAELISKENTEINFDSKENFLKLSVKIIEKHLPEADFNLDEFASEMNISKPVLHRKFKLLVGQTPNQLIRLVRLRKSVELLQNSELSISEIAYMTGFNQSHYFIKCFKEVYNLTPKAYRSRKMRNKPIT